MKPRIAVILVFTGCLAGQGHRTSGADVNIVAAHPTVVLHYQRTGPRAPAFSDESSKGLWLTLQNNMKVPIYVRGFDTGDRGGGLALLHEVVPKISASLQEAGIPRGGVQSTAENRADALNIPRGYDDQHVSSVIGISPGDSLSFSFPVEHLGANRYIRVRFVYDWELKTESREPQHYVSFKFEDVPVRERLKLHLEPK